MGLSDEEFGDLTYALFEALLKRKEEEDRKKFIHTGIIAAATINFSGNITDPVDPMDFVPGQQKEIDLSKMTPEQQAEHVHTLFNKKNYTKSVGKGDRILNG